LTPETFFKGLDLATRPSIYHQPTEAQLRVNIYCIFNVMLAEEVLATELVLLAIALNSTQTLLRNFN
jgi:hypothetical protein